MASTRRSNTERRRAREECREKLSEHIRQRLGIRIGPAEVRLKPCIKDPYAWRVLQGKEEFFSQIFATNLSSHSTSTYRILCREVGKSFEAVHSDPEFPTPDTITSLSFPEPSFRTTIDKLKEENSKLFQEINHPRTNHNAELKRRELLEVENRQLHIIKQQLQSQMQNYSDAVDYLRNIMSRYILGLDKVLPMLEDLRKQVALEEAPGINVHR
ncbi:hypothetical protein B0T26DRAFT_642395 [Lasiosphaeria miniovina]|uniref:Uncharacterized protein n=1 Tax=Lasiosphaeria miniovina TaxID=1954250 RepID=A0AA40AWV1_9PEZI|nr:uncharacterized protein B0T26DRAFT_642395 [Lasiosphaeria miniovina]KAK0723475.1 hypothetical protein B0T26DRAFT_642395 [Lasiosphaeria miniovina]